MKTTLAWKPFRATPTLLEVQINDKKHTYPNTHNCSTSKSTDREVDHKFFFAWVGTSTSEIFIETAGTMA
jgi:hypothetical protein